MAKGDGGFVSPAQAMAGMGKVGASPASTVQPFPAGANGAPGDAETGNENVGLPGLVPNEAGRLKLEK